LKDLQQVETFKSSAPGKVFLFERFATSEKIEKLTSNTWKLFFVEIGKRKKNCISKVRERLR